MFSLQLILKFARCLYSFSENDFLLEIGYLWNPEGGCYAGLREHILEPHGVISMTKKSRCLKIASLANFQFGDSILNPLFFLALRVSLTQKKVL